MVKFKSEVSWFNLGLDDASKDEIELLKATTAIVSRSAWSSMLTNICFMQLLTQILVCIIFIIAMSSS